MRPIGIRRFIREGLSAAVLLVAPCASAGTVDLGTVAVTIGINASILNTDFPMDTETYTYQQLLFAPGLSLVFDGGQGIYAALASALGNANTGTLDYNFPFTLGASGSYTQNGSPPFPGSGNPGTLSFTAQTQSGHACAGANAVGSTINLNPLFSATDLEAILGCDALGPPTDNIPPPTTTTTTIPLGTITSGGTTTLYEGEVVDTEWTVSGVIGPATSAPEPGSLFLMATGIGALFWIRAWRRSSPPAR
jgi:PEP-CTERM motif